MASYGGGMQKGAIGSVVDERVANIMSQRQSGGGMGFMGGGGPGGGGPGGASQFRMDDLGGETGPSATEIVDYAWYIGMDPIGDVNLLWIAEEALCASLPEGW